MFQYNQIFVANLVIQKSAFLGGDTFNFGKKKIPWLYIDGTHCIQVSKPRHTQLGEMVNK